MPAHFTNRLSNWKNLKEGKMTVESELRQSVYRAFQQIKVTKVNAFPLCLDQLQTKRDRKVQNISLGEDYHSFLLIRALRL